jgi:hypothetical protein
MSIAEMEAEAEEVREEVRRRKGRKASRLPLMLMLLRPGSRGIHRLRLLQQEQHCGVLLAIEA